MTRPHDRRDFETDAKRFLALKSDTTIAALIRGIDDPGRADRWIRAEVELADEDDRDPRKEVIGLLNRVKVTQPQG